MICINQTIPSNFLKAALHKFFWSILEYFVSNDIQPAWIFFKEFIWK